LTKLASGKRVVSAKDDAASLAIGSRLNAEVVAMKTAKVNAGQAGSMLQIADGAMATISDILVRMKELAVQASSGQFSSTERSILDSEFQALKNEITRISDDTEFNGTQLIAGGATTKVGLLDGTNSKLEIADGFTSFTFDNDVKDSPLEITFTAATDVMTVRNLDTGVVSAVTIDATAIAGQTAGATTDVRFEELGLTIALNTNFTDADITTANSTALAPGAAGALVAAAGGITISSIDLKSTTGITDLGAAADVTIQVDTGTDGSDATITLVADGNDFIATGVDIDTAGTVSVALTRAGTDADGVSVTDTITLSMVIGTGASGHNDENQTVTLGNFQNAVFADQTGDATKTTFTFKVGTGNQTYDSLTFDVNAASSSALNIGSNDILTAATAETASTAVSAAIDTLNTSRSEVGAAQNRLTFASANLSSAIENAEAARSTLLDLDVAAEMTAFTSRQVLMQTGIAMLAQANQIPQNLLRLFQ
jgi:flagellin